MATSRTAVMILGLLAEGNRHGYDLLREMELRGLLRWTRASRVAVYKNLARLEKEGYLASWKEKDGNLPERTVYGITAEGERRLGEMVFDLLSSREPLRLDYAVGAAFIDRLPREEAEEGLERRREFLRAQVKRLSRERDMLEGVSEERLGSIRDREIAAYREELRWLERISRELRSLPDGRRGRPG